MSKWFARNTLNLFEISLHFETQVSTAPPTGQKNEVRLTRLQVELNTIIIVPKKEQM